MATAPPQDPPKDPAKNDGSQEPARKRRPAAKPKDPPADPPSPPEGAKRVLRYDVYEFLWFFPVVIGAGGEEVPGEKTRIPVCIARDVEAVNRKAAISLAVKDRDPALDNYAPDSPWGLFGTAKSAERIEEQPRLKKVTVEPDWGED